MVRTDTTSKLDFYKREVNTLKSTEICQNANFERFSF